MIQTSRKKPCCLSRNFSSKRGWNHDSNGPNKPCCLSKNPFLQSKTIVEIILKDISQTGSALGIKNWAKFMQLRACLVAAKKILNSSGGL